MKIYLVDNTKITKFVLLSKSDDFFLTLIQFQELVIPA